MLFCSTAFLVFFLVVFPLYWAVPRARVGILLVSSFAFYASWNRWLALLITVSTLLDYLVARGMVATRSPHLKRMLLLTSLVANLGMLAYFKYANFFLGSLGDLLTFVGVPTAMPVLQILLPVGISFYTFEAINYTVDVYTGRMEPEKKLSHFMLFILFFPHLIAGPIVRARDFLPQVRRHKHWNWLRMSVGVRLFLLGMFKKLAIADRIPAYVDPVYLSPESFSTGVLWLAAFAYAVQLFCDFSGYSDMAIGLAHLFGYRLARNFNLPYIAPNMGEFWRRWHISLSEWIRDYLFIPLGGSRGSTVRVAGNLLLTMTLCGLWHGAAWNYVAFGFVQGLLLVGHRTFRTWCKQRPGRFAWLETGPGTLVRVVCTFCMFSWTLCIFRCATLATSGVMLPRMLFPHAGKGLPLHPLGLWITFGVVLGAHLIGRIPKWEHGFNRLPAPVRGLLLALMLILALVLAPDASKAFIYFQF